MPITISVFDHKNVLIDDNINNVNEIKGYLDYLNSKYDNWEEFVISPDPRKQNAKLGPKEKKFERVKMLKTTTDLLRMSQNKALIMLGAYLDQRFATAKWSRMEINKERFPYIAYEDIKKGMLLKSTSDGPQYNLVLADVQDGGDKIKLNQESRIWEPEPEVNMAHRFQLLLEHFEEDKFKKLNFPPNKVDG
jgi:hypothetical protein